MGKRVAHVHLAKKDSKLWEGLAFRNYLSTNPEIAAEYAELKRQLAMQHQSDRERYTLAKTEFIKKVTQQALSEL